MQNRGFIKFFAIALGLICLFYLSFSFVARHYTNLAEKYATTDGEFNEAKYNSFIDSISSNKIWLGYTYKEALDREVSLGLDLKGGMNVTLEISQADILRALSGNNPDENFNKAVNMALERQQTSNRDFITLFEQAYLELDKEARLSGIFATFELKEKITPNSTNAEVIVVLRKEVDSAINNSFNVLRSRIDRFGVVQPNIQRLENSGRILVELPGVKEKERVRKLLQGTANLEFFETYDLALDPDIFRGIMTANTIIRDLQASTNTTNIVKTDTLAAETETTESEKAEGDLLAEAVAAEQTSPEDLSSIDAQNNPLFSVLQVSQQGGPVVGRALAKDTAVINQYFALKQVRELFPRDMQLKWTVKAQELELADGSKRKFFDLIAIKGGRDGKAALDGSVITDARDDFSQFGGSEVSMTMDAEGARAWAILTKQNIGRSIAIVLDGYVYSYPNVNTEITGGRSQITGNFTPEEAKDLANVLKSGTMPAPARIVQEDIVGPSLGQEAIDSGLMSFVIAFIFVMIYMVFYYGWKPGMVANFALLANLFFLVGILVAWRATLTLPGIAGIVLTMGMAIDSNVLIYERIREELNGGKNIKKAVTDGFKNAISAIVDANITTIITGIILAYFGTGPIKGFATTLIIGILTSIFTAVFVTRLILEWMAEKDKLKHVAFTTNFTKNWFQNTKFDFIKARKKAYIVVGVIVAVTIISLFTRGLDPGIDFTGGRNYVVRFDQSVNTTDVQDALKDKFEGATLAVTTIGTDNQARISTNYGIDNNSEDVDDQIEELLFQGLQPFLGNNVTLEMFTEGYIVDANGNAQLSADNESTLGIQSSQKVGPTIADDIKTSAVWSIIFAVIAIGLYILLRFRDFSFSIGAIASLVLNVIIVLCAYSLLYSIMPFSLEIDQQFIAAVLTVVGYSINDTVVVFDRIRELIGLYPKRDRKNTINNALNATLSRTFSTTFSTVLVLIIIFIFGGDVIRGFIFALLIGISVGAFSTLFVASPIAYEIQSRKKRKELEK
jgi:SecD/SecF fusion protein